MPSYSTDRRGALKILGAIGATCACPIAGEELFGRTVDEPHVHDAPRAREHFFAEQDFKAISRVADLIIPRTDTAGAVDADVPTYIDLVISRNPGQQALAADGLRWLSEHRFLELDETQQLAMLQPLCDNVDRKQITGRLTQFFALIKGLTTDGYYTSQVGLMQELAYIRNAALAHFPECVHEH